MEYDEFRAMNTQVVLAGEGEPAAVTRGFGAARDFILASEARLTRFSEASELAELNRFAGRWFHASPDLFDIVQQARLFVEETEGLFDPSVLGALESAGYDRSMDELRVHGASRPTQQDVASRGDFRDAELDPASHRIRLPVGTRIDLGGIAKGWIAEQAARRLAVRCSACAVNAGGDLFCIGRPDQEQAWQIGLDDPNDGDHVVAILNAPPGAVATSSIATRRWVQAGTARHHLIDPRTGLPAETDWLTVTVLTPHATTAEVFAKALLIGGSRDATRIAAARPDLAFIAIDGSGRLWGSANAEEFLDVGMERI
jgi:thiamine biosynthesis lipoprotein